MPELPEVETTRRGIAPHLVNRKINKVIVRNSSLRWPVPKNLPELLNGCRLVDVKRRGKYLLLSVKSRNADEGVVIIHLGMSGSLRIVNTHEAAALHDHVDLVFSGGKVLRYTDPRRFGCVLWQDADAFSHDLLRNLGPEPLSDEFDGEHLYRLSRKRKLTIKAFIMDSVVVVGVGNIYANEALFSAGIRPDRAAGTISRQRYLSLGEEIKRVLAAAIEQGGTTLKDFVGGDGKPGYFKQQLNVYSRQGMPCVNCKTELKEIRLAQRSTVFCNRCQS